MLELRIIVPYRLISVHQCQFMLDNGSQDDNSSCDSAQDRLVEKNEDYADGLEEVSTALPVELSTKALTTTILNLPRSSSSTTPRSSSSTKLNKPESLAEVLKKTMTTPRSSSSTKLNKPESLGEVLKKTMTTPRSSSSTKLNKSDEEESDSSDFVSDEWALMSLNFQIAYGSKRMCSKEPKEDDINALVKFLETTKSSDEKREATNWLHKFMAYQDKYPKTTIIRRTGTANKAKSVLDPASPIAKKTIKGVPRKKVIEIDAKDEEKKQEVFVDSDIEDIKVLSVPEQHTYKVLTTETIAKMKANFDNNFHRHFDKEDRGDYR